MKKFRTVFIVLLIISGILNVKAEQGPGNGIGAKIKGILIEEKDTVPIEFANVALYKQSDSTLVTWTVSTDKGVFELVKVPVGNYKLVTNYLGFEKRTINNIVVSKEGVTVELGKVTLQQTNTAVKEVTFVGVQKSIVSKIDRKVINVSNDINSTGGTAIDVLKNVPGLSVDADGNVSLRGSSDVSILVDGRPTSIDASKLDQIPSSELESVEIISNPTAKYNPEGKSGIINLKLKQKKAAGINGNASFTAGTGNKYTTGISLNYNVGKINLFASYNGMFKKIVADRYLLRESLNSDTTHFLQQNATTNLDIQSNKFSLGAKFNPNPQNTFTVSYTNNPFKKTDADGTLSQYFNHSRQLTNTIFTDNTEYSKSNSQDYLLGYRKNFDKKGEELTIDYTYSLSNEYQNQPQTFHFLNYLMSDEIFSKSNNFNSDLQINWVLPIGSDSKIESGIQSIVRGTKIDYYQNDLIADSWVKDNATSNTFTYNEQIHSVYSTISGKFNIFSYIAGLRLEQTLIDGMQSVNSEKIKHNYFNFYPSLSFMYSFNQTNELQLSYSRRINRPTARQINPFIDKSNLEVFRSGNPNLNPEYINSFELGYNGNWGKTNAGVTIFYKQISNLINQVTLLDSIGISHIAPQNITSCQNLGFELTYELVPTHWWKFNGNGSFYKYLLQSDNIGNSNSNYSYNARLNNIFTPINKTSIQLVSNYTGPIIAITSKMKPQFSIDIAVKRDFFDNKLSLTARATDIFNTLKSSYTSWSTNFTADNWRKMQTRVFYISVSYNFGTNGSKKSKSNGNNESTHSTEIF
jgi:outer membrane receptor protein involved in Fe transport